MTTSRRSRALGVLAVGAVTLVIAGAGVRTASAQDADFRCRQTINREYTRYAATIVRILQRCNDTQVKAGNGVAAPGGDIAACDARGTIALALGKLGRKIVTKCDGKGVSPAAIGWPSTCPNFESGSCANTVASGSDLAACLDCIARAAVTQAMDRYYVDLANPGGDGDVIKCQRAVGKEATKFLGAKQRALSTCRARVDKGQGSLPCPVPGDGNAGPAIAKAESKKAANICKACGSESSDGATCAGGGLTPAQIGFVPQCPAVTVPFGGPACARTVATLSDLVACVDCLTEFKVDCMDVASRPDQVSYPPECHAGGTTPTATAGTPTPIGPTSTSSASTPVLTPTATRTATRTSTPSRTPTTTPTRTMTPTPSPTATVSPVCGDGVTAPPEECDDHNTTDGDGCSSTCQLESMNPALCAGVPSTAGTSLDVVRIASGLEAPVHVTAPRLDPSRIFVSEQPGRIQLIKNGTLLGTPFLDIENLVTYVPGGEQGFLSVAFDPAYESNRRFYVYYDDNNGDLVIARYQVSAGDPDIADPSTAHIIVTIPHPGHTNHNGGNLNFSPDGFLYAGTGDGGGTGDPNENSQNDASLLGKLLRIDPATDAITIWAKGLRNPYRFSFDRANGDIYIGDVGQGHWEEVDYVAGNPSGINYGWDDMEGRHCYEPPSGCLTSGRTLPVLEYCNSAFSSASCTTFQSEKGQAVTGGFVYRGCAMPDLRGRYFYADFYTAFIHSFMGVSGGDAQNLINHTADLAPSGGLAIDHPSSFGEDTRGELYIADYDGDIFKIVPGS